MRANFLMPAGALLLLLLAGTTEALGQPPGMPKRPQAPPDDEKAILNEIKEAYKAPFEVHEDVLKELRKNYQQPTPEREDKIFRELRRLYLMTPEQEAAILREIRRAYQQPTAAQEERIFREIGRAERLPEGAVPATVQAEQARKLFLRLDLNGDGVLSAEEAPDILRGERARWDGNRDGFIDPGEYWTYYQGRLESLSEQVAAGEIDLGLKRGGPGQSPVPAPKVEPRPAVNRPGPVPAGLPDWFARLDTDRDGQVGLYEWRRAGRPLNEFLGMDANDDGFLTAEELRRHLAQQPQNRATNPTRGGPPKVSTSGKP